MRTLFALTRKELGLALMVVNHTLLATGAPAIPIAISGELSRAFLFSHFAEPTRQRPDPAAEHRWDLTGHLLAATVAINISLALTKAALGPPIGSPGRLAAYGLASSGLATNQHHQPQSCRARFMACPAPPNPNYANFAPVG